MNHPFGLTRSALEAVLAPGLINKEGQNPSDEDSLIATTLALGEEGGGITDFLSEGGDATTLALGEEGGDFTTLAFGEEGGDMTTLALGEEGGDFTTMALGEEGGFVTDAIGEDGDVTSQALGEEGGVTTLAVGEEGGDIPLASNDLVPSSELLNSLTALGNFIGNEYLNSGQF